MGVVVAAVLATASGGVLAREPTQAPNPYQGELPFETGRPLDPEVVIAGVDWFLIEIDILDELEPGRSVRTDVTLGFRNTSTENVEVLVVLLLQDADGVPLERVTLHPVRVRDGRERTEDDRYDIPSEALQQVQTLYVLCQVVEA